MYEEFTGEDRKIIGEALTQFEAILNKQDKVQLKSMKICIYMNQPVILQQIL